MLDHPQVIVQAWCKSTFLIITAGEGLAFLLIEVNARTENNLLIIIAT